MKLFLASAIVVSCINFVYSISSSIIQCSYRTAQPCYDAINNAEDSEFYVREENEFGLVTVYSFGCQTFQSDLIKIKGCERCRINPKAGGCREEA